jgi:hypothetical protein
MPRLRVENIAAFAGMLGSLPRGGKTSLSFSERLNADSVPRHIPAKGAYLVNLMPPQELLCPDHLQTEFTASYKLPRSVPTYDNAGGIFTQWTRYQTQHIVGALPIDTLQISQRVFRTVDGAENFHDVNTAPGRPFFLDGLPYLCTVDERDAMLFGWEKVLEFQKVQIDDQFDSDIIKTKEPCMLLCAVWRQENVICRIMAYILEEVDGIALVKDLVRKVSAWTEPRLAPVVSNFKTYRPGEPNASLVRPPNATVSHDAMANGAVVF